MMKQMGKVRKFALVALAMGAGVAKAEFSTAAIVTSVTEVSTGLGAISTAVVPLLGAVVLAGIALWAIPAIIGIVKRAFGAGKGR